MQESGQRNLTGWDFFLLWAGAGIALTEIWAGGLLLPLGLGAALLAILLGHLIGGIPMAMAGLIGARHGVPAMISTRAALGTNGSKIAAVLNVIQLLGWTGVMLWVGGQAATKLFPALGAPVWIAICGVLTTFWALGGHRIWKPLQRISVVLLFALSLWMTFVVLKNYSFAELWKKPAAGGLPFAVGLDIVIAMPISWLPLAADYARFSTSPRTSFLGTFLGYLLASSWMYAVGVFAGLATGSATPEAAVMDLMAAQKLGLAALLIVLLSTFTTTFLDLYSNTISTRSLAPALPEKGVTIAGGVLGTVIALLFSAHQYEAFLLSIGSAFCPLFGVVLVDYFIRHRGHYTAESLRARAFNPAGLASWAGGFLVYQLCASPAGGFFPIGRSFAYGSSLPAMLSAALLYLMITRGRRPQENAS